jgi:acyl-CoA reductase-like NAD-dependent aldehyde dehydrogenase
VLRGLTRGLDPATLEDALAGGAIAGGGDAGAGAVVAFQRQAELLGCVLPSNSPGVHGLWLPAIPLRCALALKPGSEEPLTPWRLLQALLRAGLDPAAVSFYPGAHDLASELLARAPRSLLFGDGPAVDPWRDDPRVQVHGPGRSKVVLSPAAARDWPAHLDLIVRSALEGSGRSCLNASAVRVARPGDAGPGLELARKLAERFAAVDALPLDHPQAALAAMPAARARSLSAHVDRLLQAPGARDLTREARGGDRVRSLGGLTFLLPTVVWCDSPRHPLADLELPFPFVAVAESKASELAAELGPSLAVTLVGDDPELRRALLRSPHVDRLNLGAVPTTEVRFDQPHEGNLFAHLYRQRALAMAGGQETARAAG